MHHILQWCTWALRLRMQRTGKRSLCNCRIDSRTPCAITVYFIANACSFMRERRRFTPNRFCLSKRSFVFYAYSFHKIRKTCRTVSSYCSDETDTHKISIKVVRPQPLASMLTIFYTPSTRHLPSRRMPPNRTTAVSLGSTLYSSRKSKL